MKRGLLLAAALACSSALAAPFVWPAAWSVDAPGEAKRGGEFRAYTESDFKTFNPFTNSLAIAVPNEMARGTGLFMQDPVTDDFVPYMAEGAPQVSNGGKRFVISIRPGMKFSDGQEVTADDFVTTMRIHMDKAVGSNAYSGFFLAGKPITVKKLGTYRLQFDFPQASSTAYSRMSFAPWPDHVYGKAYRAGGAEAVKKLGALNTDPKTLVTAGMWALDQYRPGERALFTKNKYWGEWNKDSAGNALPYLDRYSFAVVRDTNAALAAFIAGQLDVGPALTADHLAQIKKALDAGQLRAEILPNVSSQAISTWIVFNWNKASDPFKEKLFRDVRFRRAMNHLADRDAMVNLVLGGLGTPEYFSVYPIYAKTWVPANLPRTAYDPVAAQRLLAQLGFTRKDAEGWLIDSQGRRLEFNLTTFAGMPQVENLMRVFADSARKAGVKVNTNAVDINVLVNQLDSSGPDRPFDAILSAYSGGGNIWPFLEREVPCAANLHAYNKSGRCLTPQEQLMERLYYQGDQELDLAKRKQIAAQFLKVESELLPRVFLAAPNYHVVFNSRVGGNYPRALMNADSGSRALALTFIK